MNKNVSPAPNTVLVRGSKGIAHLLLLIAVILIAIAVVGYLSVKNKPQSSIPLPTPTRSITQNETVNWKTYKNTKYNYSLKYPNSFFTTNTQEDGVVIFYFSDAGEVSLFERPQISIQIHEKTTLMDIVNTVAEGKRTVQEIFEEGKITPAEDGPLDLELQETKVNGQDAYYFEKIKEDYMGIRMQ